MSANAIRYPMIFQAGDNAHSQNSQKLFIPAPHNMHTHKMQELVKDQPNDKHRCYYLDRSEVASIHVLTICKKITTSNAITIATSPKLALCDIYPPVPSPKATYIEDVSVCVLVIILL
jgi:hypothetical protein